MDGYLNYLYVFCVEYKLNWLVLKWWVWFLNVFKCDMYVIDMVLFVLVNIDVYEICF